MCYWSVQIAQANTLEKKGEKPKSIGGGSWLGIQGPIGSHWGGVDWNAQK